MVVSTRILQRFAVNQSGRDFAVGDIHGCFSKLEAALRRVGFIPEKDRLFSVGDLVDRGPESHRFWNGWIVPGSTQCAAIMI